MAQVLEAGHRHLSGAVFAHNMPQFHHVRTRAKPDTQTKVNDERTVYD